MTMKTISLSEEELALVLEGLRCLVPVSSKPWEPLREQDMRIWKLIRRINRIPEKEAAEAQAESAAEPATGAPGLSDRHREVLCAWRENLSLGEESRLSKNAFSKAQGISSRQLGRILDKADGKVRDTGSEAA